MTADNSLLLPLLPDPNDFCALVMALPTPGFVTDVTGRVLHASPAAERLLHGGTGCAGQSVMELLPFISLPETEERRSWQGSITDPAGALVEVEVSCAPLTCRAPGGHLYLVHDVSHLAGLSRLKEQFLYNVAHELRGPLAVLDNALEILGEDYGELSADEFQQLLGSARQTANRLHALMDDLLSAGAIQAGRFTVHARPTQVAAIIEDGLAATAAQREARGQQVTTGIAEGLPPVRADLRAIGRVLTNLIGNASKYSPAGSALQVRASAAGRFVRISVEDNGPGIPEEQQAGLFERFYRARPGDEPPGIGLGLAIARGIIEAHGGTIDVDRERQQGTHIWFTLPVA